MHGLLEGKVEAADSWETLVAQEWAWEGEWVLPLGILDIDWLELLSAGAQAQTA